MSKKHNGKKQEEAPGLLVSAYGDRLRVRLPTGRTFVCKGGKLDYTIEVSNNFSDLIKPGGHFDYNYDWPFGDDRRNFRITLNYESLPGARTSITELPKRKVKKIIRRRKLVSVELPKGPRR